MNSWPHRASSQLIPLKHVCRLNPETLPETTEPEYEMEYIDIGSVAYERGIENRERMRFRDAPSRARKPIRNDDTIIATVRTYLKAIAFVERASSNWVASTGFAVCRPLSHVEPRYLWRAVQSTPFVESVVASSTGASYPAINPSTLGNLLIPLPALPTQKSIADFLDRETARIDQLIGRKERLIEVAVLRQAAQLDQATFGSNELPEWTRAPFKWCCTIPAGQVDPKTEPWSLMPLIAPNHIEIGTGRILKVESAMEQGAESGKYSYPAGTVLYSKIRPALAKACIAPQQGLCSADMYPITPSRSLLPGFLLMQLLSRTFTDWAVMESMRVAMPKVNRETLGRFPLILAPLERQHELVDQWSVEADRTQALVDKVRCSLACLREYRAALITAAVTGQIDVATWGKRGETDRRLEAIQHALEAAREGAPV